ncbi:hypothetical protein FKP32DRAFT_437891 [Trametes sanguinea]|nr:hypothetical protein FKP32DRAFT_437891 [Trametes sanguinea]
MDSSFATAAQDRPAHADVESFKLSVQLSTILIDAHGPPRPGSLCADLARARTHRRLRGCDWSVSFTWTLLLSFLFSKASSTFLRRRSRESPQVNGASQPASERVGAPFPGLRTRRGCSRRSTGDDADDIRIRRHGARLEIARRALKPPSVVWEQHQRVWQTASAKCAMRGASYTSAARRPIALSSGPESPCAGAAAEGTPRMVS